MGTVSRVHTFASGAILTAAQLNNEFDNLLTSSAINGGLDATNLGVTAGQATASKALVVDASRNLADATGSNRINNLALSGTFESTGAITATAGITSGGNIVSDTDSTDDLGTTGVRWANLFVDDITVTNNVSIGGTLTLTGGITLNGNTTIGDSSADTLTVNSTITSNLIFTDATYDIGASGATRPRNLYLSGNGVVGGTLGVTGATTLSSTLGVTGLITASGGVSGTTGTFSGAVNANNLVLDASGNYPILLENQAGTTADAAISTFDDANGTLLALGSNFYFSSGGSETRFNTSEEAAGIVLNRTGTISLRTSDGSNNTVERVSVGNTGDFAVNTSQLFVDQSASRVGINKSSPDSVLHLYNSGALAELKIEANGVANPRLTLYNNSTYHSQITYTNDLQIYSNGGSTRRLVLDSSGHLDLETGYLKVSGNPSAGTISSNGNGQIGGLTGNGLYMYGKGSTYDLALANANTTVALAIPTAGSSTPDVYIPNSLGIGTSSPGEKLTVVGGGSTTSTANFTGGATNDNGTLASDYGMFFQIDANNTVGGRIYNWRVGGKGYSDGTSLLTLNASGNMGLGDTPNAYNSAHRALQLGSRGANIAGRTDSDTIYVNANAYQHTDGNWKYDSTDEASQYYQTGGTHNWRRAASGTAGTNITWTTQAVLDSTGLGVNTTAPAQLLEINGDANPATLAFRSTTSSAHYMLIRKSGSQLQFVDTGNDGTTEREVVMVVDGNGSSDGRVGIGTTSPLLKLHVQDDVTGGAYNQAVGQIVISGASNTNKRLNIGFDTSTDKAFLQSGINGTGYNDLLLNPNGGSVGIGTSSPVALSNQTSLTVNGTSVGRVDVKAGGGGGGVMFGTSSALTVQANSGVAVNLDSASGQPITFQVGSSEKARFDASGNFIVGKTTTSAATAGASLSATGAATFVRDSDCLLLNRPSTTGTIAAFRQANTGVGSISVTASTTSYNTSSDYRLKENIIGITDGITRIKSLKPSRFNFIAEADRTVDGFVAHEVSDVVPEAISGAKDAVDEEGNPEYQGIDQSKLVPLLTAALQEAITKIETLETKVAALEAA